MKYNQRIISVMVVICAMFLSLAVYLTYFTLFEAETVVENRYNKRIREREEAILRGTIYDASGEVLALSKMENGQKRIYPFNERYAHLIGYNSVTYDRVGLEASFNKKLIETNPLDEIANFFTNQKKAPEGADLYLTIDNRMTALAEELMAGKNGSVIALVPKTGEVLCMYSNPTFDPNEKALRENFSSLTKRDDAPFVARCTQGLYAPGSTFKIITAAAALESGIAENVTDTGSLMVDGYEIKNFEGKSLGEIDIKTGFAKSSNVMFASYGTTMGEAKLKEVAKKFGIGEKIPFDIATNKSLFNYPDGMSKTDLAACGIGQGKLLVTPLNMALVASGIANDGVIMAPYIVEKAAFNGGRKVYSAEPKVWKNAVSKAVADKIGEYMIECVNTGTGTGAQIDGIQVAGKTGTAENEREGEEHAWFVCYAPAENPQIAICVMQEYTGRTGSSCTPIAKALIEYYLQR
ncbi:MAG: peptidoglycan glycosyltransferase [Clostridia bacterium]|nr:peptidoglycan glycosyltransferase [Clostridia bacterium]